MLMGCSPWRRACREPATGSAPFDRSTFATHRQETDGHAGRKRLIQRRLAILRAHVARLAIVVIVIRGSAGPSRRAPTARRRIVRRRLRPRIDVGERRLAAATARVAVPGSAPRPRPSADTHSMKPSSEVVVSPIWTVSACRASRSGIAVPQRTARFACAPPKARLSSRRTCRRAPARSEAERTTVRTGSSA